MNHQIRVQPLKRGEEDLWTSIGVPQNEVASRCQKLTEYLSSNPTLPPEHYLLACQGEKLVGKMSGILESTGYIATSLHVADESAQSEIADALFAHVKGFGCLKALSWAREDNSKWRKLLTESGFMEKEDRAYYRRKVSAFKSNHDNPFQLISLNDLGESSFLEIYRETYLGNSNRNFNNESPETDFRSHIESAGVLFDPNRWYVAMKENCPLGIVLPQRFPDSPHEGTLMSLGLLPKARGKGYGKVLHAIGLEILANQGATDYIGSTDVQNIPMIKVFEKNQCEFVGIRTTHGQA